jgi:hypothetical protein
MMKRIKIKGVKALQEASISQGMVNHVTSQVDPPAQDKTDTAAAVDISDDKKQETNAAPEGDHDDDEEDEHDEGFDDEQDHSEDEE